MGASGTPVRVSIMLGTQYADRLMVPPRQVLLPPANRLSPVLLGLMLVFPKKVCRWLFRSRPGYTIGSKKPNSVAWQPVRNAPMSLGAGCSVVGISMSFDHPPTGFCDSLGHFDMSAIGTQGLCG